MDILSITAQSDGALLTKAAAALVDAFADNEDWNTLEGALEEIHEVIAEGVLFVAVENDRVIGIIGALNAYHGYTWELHPLGVTSEARWRGVGRALVAHLESAAREAGVTTMMLGTDDEDGRTNLSLVDDLYALLPGILANITSLDPDNPHPVDFYRKCGYAVVGVVPDANGTRKPDIYMAKRL